MKLIRQTFIKDRWLDFFTEAGLAAQLGYGRDLWPIVLAKELIDNSLDACENAGLVAPEISLQLKPGSLTVYDNGPGLPESTLLASLDYEKRVSDKIHYVAPTEASWATR